MKINRLHAEQHYLGELPPGHVLPWTEVEAQQSDRELKAADADHLARYPAAQAAASIARKLARSSRPLSVQALRFGPLVAAAALIVGLGTGPLLGELDSERTKGSSTKLAVYRQSSQGVLLLADGARAKAGDRLQVEFLAPSQSWVLVFSVDGAGVLTTHFPSDSQGTQALRAVQVAGTDTLVNQAYVLDNAPKFERFYLVVAQRAFNRDTAWNWLREHPLDTRLPGGLTAYPLTLTKEP